MLIALIQVLFAAIRTVSRSAVNIVLYSMLSKVFHRWLGFHIVISFFCSAYCLSKIVGYFKRLWLNARLTNKKPEEKIDVKDLIIKRANGDRFEADWKSLIDEDRKNLFPSIVDIPFNNSWLFLLTLMVIDYQTNNWDYTYFQSLLRTISFLIVLICGSAIRYQTLFEREKNALTEALNKQRETVERFIVYSEGKTRPVASICLQLTQFADVPTFIVQMYHFNSIFDDYFYDIEHFLCQTLISQVKNYSQEKKTSARLIWSIPTCREKWTALFKTYQIVLRHTYEDFSFMPLVKSHIQQYEYFSQYEEA